jgi:membrane associated rhomboid family serine protease
MRGNSLKDDFRALVANGNSLNQLIVVNIVVYIGLSLIAVILALFKLQPGWYHIVSGYLAVPAYLPNLLFRPWSLLTYMFVHGGFFHILFNMLWLYWIGRIFQDFLGTKKLVALYFLGGFAGALMYIISFNFFPLFSTKLVSAKAVGASASVLAIVVGTATLLPNYTLRLFLFGNVPLKYLALFMIVIDLLSLAGNNAGGHFAHLGGAIFWLCVYQAIAGRA